MTRLRRMLERGRAHPILGPIVLILLVLLLAMVFVHAAHEGDGAAEIGGICIAIASFLGLLVADAARRGIPAPLGAAHRYRGPPGQCAGRASAPLAVPSTAPSLPLRR